MVHGDRGDAYGHPKDDFEKQAIMMSQVLRRKLKEPISAGEVPLLMVCVKLSRLENTPGHKDSLVDIAGYAETCAMVYEESE